VLRACLLAGRNWSIREAKIKRKCLTRKDYLASFGQIAWA
jgi:hypothetical protein